MNQYDPDKHHRRSIRLRGWDYRSPGLYFVTICTHERQHLFENRKYWTLAHHALIRIPAQDHARHVVVDESVVMPNHIHMILHFMHVPDHTDRMVSAVNFENAPSGSLGVIVGRYKTAVTTRINRLRHTPGAPVWQRGYYERIIRNERGLEAIRHYIRLNPARWAEKHDNINALTAKMKYHP